MAVLKPFIRPFGQQVVVKPIYAERSNSAGFDVRVSSGGVALPDTAENEPIECEVVKLGDGYTEGLCSRCEPHGRVHEFSVKVGDKVLVPEWKATEITLSDGDFWIVEERDICGIKT